MRLKVRIFREEFDPTIHPETKRVDQILVILAMIVIARMAIPGVQIALRVYTQTGNLSSLVTGYVIALVALLVNWPLISKLIELRR